MPRIEGKLVSRNGESFSASLDLETFRVTVDASNFSISRITKITAIFVSLDKTIVSNYADWLPYSYSRETKEIIYSCSLNPERFFLVRKNENKPRALSREDSLDI